MYITAEILKDMLSVSFEVSVYGRRLGELPLLLPAFYLKDTSPVTGGVYILRGNELPGRLSTECLYICFDSVPSAIPRGCLAEIFCLSKGPSDYLHLFNKVQEIFDTILQWECKMQTIVEHNGDLEELLRASIPVFENRIAVTDYNLNILAYCEAVSANGKKENQISRSYERVPREKSLLFGREYRRMLTSRTPFHFVDQDTQKDNYCVNLFLDQEYIGTCSLMEDYRPIRPGDYLLFQKFSEYIAAALARQSAGPHGRYVTLKAIFSQLLESMPVSQNELTQALEMASLPLGGLQNSGRWFCVTLRSANKDRQLPDGYLCAALEDLLPGCTALSYEGELVCVLPASGETQKPEQLFALLKPLLQDMNFQAGCSLLFQDVYKLRTAYRQSLCALKTGNAKHPQRLFYAFGDYLLDYMLENCCGSFEPEELLPAGLEALRQRRGSVDYWDTLNAYLEHECNASETAQSMYLHRSSLLPRLKKIREELSLDSSDERLLLRIFLRLYGSGGQKA